jgi:hypothetical protein
LSDQIGFACIGPVIICIIALIASAALSPFSNKYMLIWVQKVQQRIGMLNHAFYGSVTEDSRDYLDHAWSYERYQNVWIVPKALEHYLQTPP